MKKNKINKITKIDYINAYLEGMRNSRLGYYNQILDRAYDAGQEGSELREVKAVRYGDIPETGISFNGKDMYHEKGLSVYKTTDGDKKIKKTKDNFSALFYKNRKKIYIKGYQIDSLGSDGEPLIFVFDKINKI